MKLNNSEIKCPMCDGRKETIMNSPDDLNEYTYIEYYYKCPKCQGTGTLNWIARLTKRKEEIMIEKRTKTKKINREKHHESEI